MTIQIYLNNQEEKIIRAKQNKNESLNTTAKRILLNNIKGAK